MSRSRSRSRSREEKGSKDDRSRRRDRDSEHHHRDRDRSGRSRSRSREEKRSRDDRSHHHHRRDSRDRDHHHHRDRDEKRDRRREREQDRDRDREKQPARQGFAPLGTDDIVITERGRGTTLPAWMDVEGSKGGDISSSSSSSKPHNDERHTNTSTGTTATSTLMEMRSVAWGNQAKEEELAQPAADAVAEEDKVKADFGLSGALAKDKNTGNMYNGVVLKWTEPLDSARPTKKWRLYVFKSGEVVETLHLHRQNAYLFGRDTRIADVILQHESCSKQHAVLQYRMVQDKSSSSIPSSSSAAAGGGGKRGIVKPYLMDLGSTHKTYLNGTALEEARYYELREKDCLTFAGSTREYILLHDSSNAGGNDEGTKK